MITLRSRPPRPLASRPDVSGAAVWQHARNAGLRMTCPRVPVKVAGHVGLGCRPARSSRASRREASAGVSSAWPPLAIPCRQPPSPGWNKAHANPCAASWCAGRAAACGQARRFQKARRCAADGLPHSASTRIVCSQSSAASALDGPSAASRAAARGSGPAARSAARERCTNPAECLSSWWQPPRRPTTDPACPALSFGLDFADHGPHGAIAVLSACRIPVRTGRRGHQQREGCTAALTKSRATATGPREETPRQGTALTSVPPSGRRAAARIKPAPVHPGAASAAEWPRQPTSVPERSGHQDGTAGHQPGRRPPAYWALRPAA